jgi:hypothetical protein
MGLKVFNSLPSYIKVKINEFKRLIKNFLYCNILWWNILIILTTTKMITQYECFN